MFLKKILPIFFLIAIPACPQLSAGTIKEAKELIEIGDYGQAIDILQGILKSKPKDSEAALQLGLAWQGAGDTMQAKEAFETAKKNGSRDANYYLATLELDNYDVEAAESYIEDYRKALKKAGKNATDISQGFDEQLDRISSMLDRVEQIVVVDSIEVDAESFFKFYALAKDSGSLMAPSSLGKGVKSANPTVVFETADSRERLWAIENGDHVFELVSSSAEYGNNWTEPASLGLQLNEGGDANYPFLMPDGITLYFANDGENSIGGYDIFITRREGEDFLTPTNIGFPYNSTADDYLLAIDETKGIGWWATNRNGHDDSVTIYTFIPNEIRKNYSHNDPKLASFARLDSYKATWGDEDYGSIRQKLSTNAGASYNDGDMFEINIPGKGIYRTLDSFRSASARKQMERYLKSQKQLADAEKSLTQLRSQYSKRKKDAGLGEKILKLEDEVEIMRKSLAEQKNNIVKEESSRR